ncbi:MAG: SEC-C metal-binding domain-containing protein [Anaeromyxobacteraceae bacterium]|nr:SEC-C metal-binding domain-containing protein [Anaeromyxobacteraceae bacterium]
MTMRRFDVLFPEVAERECRTIRPMNHERLPSRRFLFLESYCVEPQCDCRRVMLSVVDEGTGSQVATINHAFEPLAPPHEDEPQTFLDPLNPQSAMSDDLLAQFKTMSEHDPSYQARRERHYDAWKALVDDPSHPDHPKVRSELHDDPGFRPAYPKREPVRREGPRTGPNEPCPCGSGKKFKKCCRK